MKKLFVRQLALFFLFALPAIAANELPPKPPANYIYDPDFLLSREGTTLIGKSLTDFATKTKMPLYLALFTASSRSIEEIALDLNEHWGQSGYGVTIAFVPRKGDVRVLPSPQLSLLENADNLTKIFRDAAEPALKRGDASGASAAGTRAILRRLNEVRLQLAAEAQPGWHLSRGWLIAIAAALLLALGFLFWRSARVWRAANLFDRSYRFPLTNEPAALRFGGMRCGGQMATSEFRAPLKAKDV